MTSPLLAAAFKEPSLNVRAAEVVSIDVHLPLAPQRALYSFRATAEPGAW